MPSGWIRHPTVRGDVVVFACEDDLWTVPLAGGRARRLTTGLGACAHPRLSADGRHIAFDGAEEGVREVYVTDADGGALRRLTYHGDQATALGWSPADEVVFSSAAGRPFPRDCHAWAVSAEGGVPRVLPYGPLAGLAWRDDGRVALCRHQTDLARWKGYRGGRMGALWVERRTGGFAKLALGPNVANPLWVGERLYFVADPDGTPQLASCRDDGTDLVVHTDHDGLAVRFPATDGRVIAYVWGGDLFAFDPASGTVREVAVDIRSQRPERQRRFPSPARYLDSVDIHPDGHSLLLGVRGRPFVMGAWEGPVRQLGVRDGVRYRLGRWIDAGRILVVSDQGGEERLEVHSLDPRTPGRRFDGFDHGRVVLLEVDPTGRRAAFTDHRRALYVVDLEDGRTRTVDRATAAPISGLDWSADGRFLAWVRPEGRGERTRVRLCDVPDQGAPADVTTGDYLDLCPSFDPDGHHLYFLSSREFDPVADAIYFGYAFPRGMRPYLATLRRDLPDPFHPEPRPLGGRPSKPERGAVQVDLDGLCDRVVPFPIGEARYEQIVGVGAGQVLLTRAPVRGTLGRAWYEPGPPRSDLKLLVWEFDKQELQELNPRVSGIRCDRRRDVVAIRSGPRLRLAQARPDRGAREELKRTDGPSGRKSGWIELGRIRASVDPGAEWAQMLDEAWRLMRDHHWDEAMGEVDWDALRARYAGLLDRIATRGELSDLIWCLQGETGTSHAYEMGGDYRSRPRWRVGRLGADLSPDPAGGWRVDRVVRGEPGDRRRSSPLAALGVGLAPGDVIVAVAGHLLRPDEPPERALVNLADEPVELLVRTGTGERRVVVRTLADDRALRYREWVLTNRRRVHEATDGRAGYVHVPDMGPGGFAEFHRDFARESERDALLVDVRHNRGGHVSQLLLERLAGRRLGYKVSRWGAPTPYPRYSVAGPRVCLTNEMAGSDGDIFSHAWKMLGLGPLVGTRTWGGTVGISPRHLLVDRGVTTQPEHATWFADVGFGLENHGTVPDEVVEFPPEAHAEGRDPQLERAIEVLLEKLRTDPVAPAPPR